MDKWDYCEVRNGYGDVTICQLTETGSGWAVTNVAESGVHNMATTLARLGKQGWEVVDLQPARDKDSISTLHYTSARARTTAFLKRRIE